MLHKKVILLILILVLASFLRIFKLEQNPPSPYWEEAALGYDAYSILKTGKDHHGNPYPLVAFESFGDWKPSLYFYTTAVSEAMFGLNTFAVRFPSCISGILAILLAYLIVNRMLDKNPYGSAIALLASLLLAITPWHILVSRVAFETNLGFFLSLLGFYLFIEAVRKEQRFRYLYAIGSDVSWALSLYAYHSNRLFIPVLMLFLCIWYRKEVLHYWKAFMLSGIFFIVLFLPIVFKMNTPQVRQRFAQTSALATLEPVLLSNEAVASHGHTLIARLMHHRYWYYANIILNNYFSHFNWNFLFINGDENRRHSVGLVGGLYPVFAPLLIVGIIIWLKKKEKGLIPIGMYLLLAPLPASFTTGTPHALRSLPMVFGFAVFAAYGLYWVLKLFQTHRLIKYGVFVGIAGILLLHVTQFWHYYWNEYRVKFASQWQYGYKELMEYIGSVQHEYQAIQVTRDLGRPAMYYWFYNKIDPVEVQLWNTNASKDQGEYLQFENIYFGMQTNISGRVLHVTTVPPSDGKAQRVIYELNNIPVIYIYE